MPYGITHWTVREVLWTDLALELASAKNMKPRKNTEMKAYYSIQTKQIFSMRTHTCRHYETATATTITFHFLSLDLFSLKVY